jgi:hypothetical protein
MKSLLGRNHQFLGRLVSHSQEGEDRVRRRKRK